MTAGMQALCASADAIRARIGDFTPAVALILGSGLGFLAELVDKTAEIPYGEIPGFPSSTAPGHEGKLVFGRLRGQSVAVMKGRFHYYEGHSFDTVVYGLRVLHLLGAQTLLVTNAAGGLGEGFQTGDIMLIRDHIKLFDESPLRGPNLDELGTRFPDMSYVYTPALQELARSVAAQNRFTLREGVYMFFPGPQFETPAEVRLAGLLGADAVGMSTVPEVIAAAHCGMRVLGFSLISNMAAGLQKASLSGVDVLEAAERAREGFSQLVLGCLAAM